MTHNHWYRETFRCHCKIQNTVRIINKGQRRDPELLTVVDIDIIDKCDMYMVYWNGAPLMS